MSENPAVMIEGEIDVRLAGGKSMVIYWHPDAFLERPPYRNIVRWMIGVWRERVEVVVVSEPQEEGFLRLY
jgi:hypothetical protein